MTSRLRPIDRWNAAQSTFPDARMNQTSTRHLLEYFQQTFVDQRKEYPGVRLVEDKTEEDQTVLA